MWTCASLFIFIIQTRKTRIYRDHIRILCVNEIEKITTFYKTISVCERERANKLKFSCLKNYLVCPWFWSTTALHSITFSFCTLHACVCSMWLFCVHSILLLNTTLSFLLHSACSLLHRTIFAVPSPLSVCLCSALVKFLWKKKRFAPTNAFTFKVRFCRKSTLELTSSTRIIVVATIQENKFVRRKKKPIAAYPFPSKCQNGTNTQRSFLRLNKQTIHVYAFIAGEKMMIIIVSENAFSKCDNTNMRAYFFLHRFLFSFRNEMHVDRSNL